MSPSSAVKADWWPDWVNGEQAILIRGVGRDAKVAWRHEDGCRPAEWLATWLGNHLAAMPGSELAGRERFAVVVLRRCPEEDDPSGRVEASSPVSLFGYGSEPVAVADWPLTRLEELLRGGVAALLGH